MIQDDTHTRAHKSTDRDRKRESVSMSQPSGAGRLSVTRKPGIVNQNGILLRLPSGQEVRITLWEYPAGAMPLDGNGDALQVRVRIDAARDIRVVREEIAGTPPNTPSQPDETA
jgi:hypothetical protein